MYIYIYVYTHTHMQAVAYKISEAKEIPVDLNAMKHCLADGYPIVFGLKLTQVHAYHE